MDEKILLIGIEDFLRFNPRGKSYQDKLLIVEIKGEKKKETDTKQNAAIRLNAFSILLARQGTISITIDNFTYHLSDNVLLDIMDLHIIKGIRFSPDFRGYHLVIDRGLFAEIVLNSRRLPASFIASRRNRPIQKLSEDDAILLEDCLRRIVHNIDRTEHAWQRDMVMNELRGFLLEVNNIIYQALRDHVNLTPPGKDMMVFLFIQLLDTHCRKEHSVAFYAKELCITPEYLSRIMKDFSGKTVNKWIAEALMREAEIALRNPEQTIQQVSDKLNFSDQSSFGKFFKKHKGMSPLEYRSTHCRPIKI